jgi:anti-sigma-K factor RskA
MDEQQLEELLPFYALDALTDEERRLVEEYLAEHPQARRQLEEMTNTVSALPLSVSLVEPPVRAKKALMARVASDVKARARAPRQSEPSLPLLSMLRGENILRTFTLGIASLAIVWVIILNAELARLRNEISALNDALVAQSNSLNEIIAKLPQATPSDVITISLKGTDVQPEAQGQLIADPDSQSAVLVIAGLPPLEAGKTYQVWLIDGGAPVSAGLLAVDENGQAVFIVTSEEAIGTFNSLGISVEPEGGSLAPTGDIVVLSEL